VNQAFEPIQQVLEPHYSPQTISKSWGWSTDAVRDLFENEPGVLVLGNRNSGRKRRYTTLRIPESVLVRVHKRLIAKT
jgi:hypothetical protein